jgi:hypothetical protein
MQLCWSLRRSSTSGAQPLEGFSSPASTGASKLEINPRIARPSHVCRYIIESSHLFPFIPWNQESHTPYSSISFSFFAVLGFSLVVSFRKQEESRDTYKKALGARERRERGLFLKKMSENSTIPYNLQTHCSQTIPVPPLLHTPNITRGAISNHIPSVSIVPSTYFNMTSSPQVLTSDGYSLNDYSFLSAEEGNLDTTTSQACIHRTAPVGVQGKCFGGKQREVKSEGSTPLWRRGKKKKKKTVSAALLIALGVAGIVMG